MKGNILTKTISARIKGIRGENTITKTLTQLKNWIQKIAPTTKGEILLRMYFKGKYKEETHYLMGLFAAISEKLTEKEQT